MVSILASGPSCLKFDSHSSQFFSEEKIVNGAEVNQRRCLKKSGQWLENVDQTHLTGQWQASATKNRRCLAETKVAEGVEEKKRCSKPLPGTLFENADFTLKMIQKK